MSAHGEALVEDDVRVLGGKLEVPPCPRCGGTGQAEVGRTTRAPTGTPSSFRAVCPECCGDGKRTCQGCGDEPAVAVVPVVGGWEALCAFCLSMAADDVEEAG